MIVNDTPIIHGWKMTFSLTKKEALFTIKNLDYFIKGNEIVAYEDHWRYLKFCKFDGEYMILSSHVYLYLYVYYSYDFIFPRIQKIAICYNLRKSQTLLTATLTVMN